MSNSPAITKNLLINSIQSVFPYEKIDVYLANLTSTSNPVTVFLFIDGSDLTESTGSLFSSIKHLLILGIKVICCRGLFNSPELSFASTLNDFFDGSIAVQIIDCNEGGDIDFRVRQALQVPNCLPILDFATAANTQDRLKLVTKLMESLSCLRALFIDCHGNLFVNGRPESVIEIGIDKNIAQITKAIDDDQAALINIIDQLLVITPCDKWNISIVSPSNIVTELLTTRGAGTYLFHEITFSLLHDDKIIDNIPNITNILESSFAGLLRKDFFKNKTQVILGSNNSCCAILINTKFGFYMSKFAVTPRFQGAGLAKYLWDEVIKCTPKIFWRSRLNNSINSWYCKIASGMIKGEKWHFFWYGHRPEDALTAMQFSFDKDADFDYRINN